MSVHFSVAVFCILVCFAYSWLNIPDSMLKITVNLASTNINTYINYSCMKKKKLYSYTNLREENAEW